jgi:hypothetical protein
MSRSETGIRDANRIRSVAPHGPQPPYEKYQLNERSHRKIVGQQISHLQRINAAVRLGVLRTLLERLMHSRGRHAQLR